MEFNIRNEEIRDIELVREIVRATFPTEAESKLVDALRANGKAMISLVAVNGDDVLGHVLFSPVTITSLNGAAPLSDVAGIGLAPVAVRPDVQSQGVGSQLIRQGLRLCKELGFDYCVVLGAPKYYSRFGFEKASDSGVGNEYGVDEEFMLIRFSGKPVTGLAQYAPEFSMFSV
jgi:putative acetyltransferase